MWYVLVLFIWQKLVDCPPFAVKTDKKGTSETDSALPSQHIWMVSQASTLDHLRCVVKSRHNLDRKWLQAQSVKGTVRQEAGELIDSELIGK